MPKIIDDLNTRILTEAKRQVFEKGYQNMTIRSVAQGCEIATGTIYNYYKSKESMVAAFMLEDWIPLEASLKKQCAKTGDAIEACHIIYQGLLKYESQYQKLFSTEEAIVSAGAVRKKQHIILRGHLAVMLMDSCAKCKNYQEESESLEFLPEFLADSLISWSVEGQDYKVMEPILKQILK